MRADARKNRDHLLAVAGTALAEQGVEVSLRDIARRADVGLATLLRHFPTREALLDALLRTSFDEMTARAAALETSDAPAEALVSWLRDCVAWTTEYRGVTVLMAAAIDDTESALHASCVALRAAGMHGSSSAPRTRARRGPTSTAPMCSRWWRRWPGSATSPRSRPARTTSSTSSRARS